MVGDSASTSEAPTQTSPGDVELRLAAERRFHAAGRLVVGGFASRIGLDVEQMHDLGLVVGALLQQLPAEESFAVSMGETDHGLDLRIGPFASLNAEAQAWQHALDLLVDDFKVETSERGDWVAVTLNRRSGSR